MRWPAVGSAFIRPLATFEVGQLTADSANADNIVAKTGIKKAWYAAGFGVSGEARLATPVAAVADLGLQVPLRHLDFYYPVGSEESHPYSVPYVGLNLRIGAIVKF